MITPLRIASFLILMTAAWLGLFGDYFTPKLADLVQNTDCGAADDACPLMDRSYNALIPEGEGPFPAVIFFHGSSLTGEHIIATEDLVRPFIERGYAFIAPTAGLVRYSGDRQRTGWRHDGSYGEDNDYGFVQALLADVTSRFAIDDSHILISGHSNGGIFSWYLACADIDDRLNAFAPASGTPLNRRPGKCKTDVPDYHLLHTHGRGDQIVPFEGRDNPTGFPGYRGSEEAITSLARRAGCGDGTASTKGMFDVQHWQDCREDLQIGLAVFEGGHGFARDWPDYILDWYEALPAGNL